MNPDISMEFFMRFLFSGIYAGIFAWMIWDRQDMERNKAAPVNENRQRYLPYISGMLLPLMLVSLYLIFLPAWGLKETTRVIFSFCFGIFLHICLYYLLLMPLLPFLRRHFSARACAVLWMLPNYLYITLHSPMQLAKPLLVLPLPNWPAQYFFVLWFTGFLAVFLWKTAQHLLFRRQILSGSRPVLNNEVWKVWRAEQTHARLKKEYELVYSPHVKTPLTIGLFRRSTRIVLPMREYTAEELAFIFRHEIVHIAREDAWNKFFLTFCTAMCWFNPLMWIAMKKSSEDLELSCDETVLLNADQQQRKQYASLLLHTAGDGRGYTTCLAASANALRYRLRSVVRPGKRHSGALVVGLTFFLLCFSCGHVALAYGGTTGAEVIFPREKGTYSFDNYSINLNDDVHREYYLTDGEDLRAFLSQLQLAEVTGHYTLSDSEKVFSTFLRTPDGLILVALHDDLLRLQPLGKADYRSALYYVRGGVDWDKLQTILTSVPDLTADLYASPSQHYKLGPHLDRVQRIEGNTRTTTYEHTLAANTFYGVYDSEGYTKATLTFHGTLAAPLRIEVLDKSGQLLHTMDATDTHHKYTFHFKDGYRKYVIYASFCDQEGTLWEAAYSFEVGHLATEPIIYE